MSKKKRKHSPSRMTFEETWGLVGGQLRRNHIADLVWDIAGLISATPKGLPTGTKTITSEQMYFLESIKETLRNASDRFEAELFIPAIQRQVELNAARERPVERQKTWETLDQFIARGGKVKKIAVGTSRETNLTLEDLGL